MTGEKISQLYMRLVLVLALVVVSALVLWQKSLPDKPSAAPAAGVTTSTAPGAPASNAPGAVPASAAAPKAQYKSPIPLGLDLSGGTELLYRIRTEGLSPEQKRDVTQRTIDVIRKRIDPEGRLELDIRPRGNFRFYIQLPGMDQSDASRIEDLIRRAGKLRFCLVNDATEDRATAARGERVGGFTPFIPVRDATGQRNRWHRTTYLGLKEFVEQNPQVQDWMLVGNHEVVTGESLDNPHTTEDRTGMPAVGFSFRGRGKAAFERATEENIGKKLAIILDEDLYSAPVINSRISGDGIIEGRFTRAEVDDMVTTLRAGQLPADIELEWNNTVGAQLGEDSIRNGIRASIIAVIVVIVFMTVYYMIGGAIANFAVLLNLLFVLGAMAGMQSVLTLPGIAGLVLTLGMAVDANVLINERIREESERGKTLRLAVRAGYERAFNAIFDSNLTTIITGLILFGVGTGPVRGFATTLTMGLIISLFTSVWVTRWVVELLVEHGVLQKLHMLHLFGRTNIAFSRARFVCIAASIVGIVLGTALFFQRGEDLRDTELTGGFRAEMEMKKGIPIAEFRKRVSSIFPNADVQSVWTTAESQKSKGELPKLFSVRIRKLNDEQKVEKMRQDFTRIFSGQNLNATIEPLKNSPLIFPEEEALARETFETRLPEYSVVFSRPVSESTLRRLLADRRYAEADIHEAIALDAASAEFTIMVKTSALSERTPDKDIAAILKPLEPMMVSQSVRLRVGEMKTEETAPAERGGAAVVRAYLPIRLNETCTTAAVRAALVRETLGGVWPDDLQVRGYGADANAEIGREMQVRGKEADLQKIYNAKKGDKSELKVFAFSMPSHGELRLTLQRPEKETTLREKLHEATADEAVAGGLHLSQKAAKQNNVLVKFVRSIIPAGVEGKEYLLVMNPLSEEKSVEKIKDELTTAFASELMETDSKDQLGVTLTPSEPPPFAADADRTAYKFFRLSVTRPLMLRDVHAALIAAGQPDSLVIAGDINKTAVASLKTDTAPVYVKLAGSDQQQQAAEQSIAKTIREKANNPFRSIEAIGAVVAGEVKNKAMLAILLSWVAMIFYLWFRFGEAKFGLATVVALIHDVAMTAGAVAVADALSGTHIGNLLGFSDIKVNVTMIAAFLTLIGYSVNDTIVVFDRIRENMGGVRRRVDAELVNTSINQTLSRTVLTSLTVFLVVGVLYILGGPVIHGFAFVMLFGVIVGTYSTIFIAAPILIGWETMVSKLQKLFRIVTFRNS